jgi:3-deoxy-manno-octulosonate cytidylyltransferase (CMP-KDO synthetase)
MRVLGIIPARFDSTRFPGKPLIDLKGKSMIQRVYEGAKKSKLITELIVATDDLRIMEEVKRFGGNVEMTSNRHPSGTDRCAEILTRNNRFDLVINIQGDEPLVDSRQLDSLIESFDDSSVQIATLATENVSKEDLDNPNRIKVVIDNSNNASYFSRSAIPNSINYSGNAMEIYPFLRHIGLYAYRANILFEITQLPPTHLEITESLEQLRWLFYEYKIRVVKTDIETPNIDVPADVENVLDLLKE